MTAPFADEDVRAWLQAANAQRDVVTWAAQHAPMWSQFWSECPRGDWLLGIAARAGVDRHDVLDAALACVEVLAPYLPDGEPVVGEALDLVRSHRQTETHATALRHVSGEIDGLMARCADPSAQAAVMAVSALLASLDDAAIAATYVAATTQAAVLDAGDCGMMQAARFTEHECARCVREVISADVLAQALSAQRAR